MSKHFIVNPSKETLSKEEVSKIQANSEQVMVEWDDIAAKKSMERFLEEDFLIHTEGRVVVKVDMKSKDSHTFESGLTIRRERNFNNFNRRETQPVNCIVISGEGIPKGAEILVDHNAFHETNRINDYKNSFESEDTDRIRYFSLERYECFAWRVGKSDWTPLYPFEFGLRIYQPYTGKLENIEPQKMKDTLYVLTGELKGNVVRTLKGCDYIVIYQNDDGREGQLLVFRPMGDNIRKLDEEAIAILHEVTEKVNSGEYLVGYEIKDAKPFKESVPVN